MKKFWAFILAVSMSSASVFAADITVTLDGEQVEFSAQEPLIQEGRTLIPLRGVFEQLGYEITFQADTKTAVFVKDGSTIEITANSDTFIINGESFTLEVPASIINGSMMLPLRAVGEAAGLTVNWDSATKTVGLLTETAADTETTEDTEITAEEIKILTDAVEDTAALYSSLYLFVSYMMDCTEMTGLGSENEYYSQEELSEFLVNIPILTDIYKEALNDINFSDKYSNCRDIFAETYDSFEDAVVYAIQYSLLENYGDISEDELSSYYDLVYSYLDEYTNTSDELVETLTDSITEILSNDTVLKYSTSENSSAAEEAASLKYNMELTYFFDNNELINNIMYAEPESLVNSGLELSSTAEALKEKVNSMETPASGLFVKYVLLKAGDLFSEAAEITKESGFEAVSGNKSYIKYFYKLKTAVSFLYIASGDLDGMLDNMLSELQ